MSLPSVTAPLPDTQALHVSIRLLSPDDVRYIAHSMRESHKDSSAALMRMPWPLYKQTVGRSITHLLEADSTRKIAAYSDDGKVVGWIAYTPGRSVSAVHWCGTRHELNGQPCRRRGVMTSLLEAADIGRRFVYTHRGPRLHTHRGGLHRTQGHAAHTVRGPSLDETLVERLRERGVTAVYVPMEEWAR